MYLTGNSSTIDLGFNGLRRIAPGSISAGHGATVSLDYNRLEYLEAGAVTVGAHSTVELDTNAITYIEAGAITGAVRPRDFGSYRGSYISMIQDVCQ